MTQRGSIVQVSISSGGVPKLPVNEGRVTELGIEGDGHDNPDVHGGPERAVCLFAMERIEAMAAEGHPIGAGSTGENITTRGIDWDLVVPGARLRLGADVLVEITRYTTPCKTNARWFKGGDFNRMHQNLFPGFSRTYARVLSGGIVRPGDTVEFLAPVAVERSAQD
ncbi:MAG: MOSC domain-containing protein [Dehalococcoidia bacterium]|nr:MOSC domain-containing protein [Dehalococcoidia bacterium]